MEINRPLARSLTPEEQLAMDQFRQRVHELSLHGGLSAQNVRNVVQAMKAHPDFSSEILDVLFEELQELQQVAPGKRLIAIEE